ncbi:hypothetical protein AWB68_08816 [Caballeronia choica]|uniref:Uncharacterized protein n=1 Tax=Caballeronia choica TaxID=326476 RepID=A0A158L592_9BURK|nr:hypothetical protein AWB68_08816 [Caballeronia choica]
MRRVQKLPRIVNAVPYVLRGRHDTGESLCFFRHLALLFDSISACDAGTLGNIEMLFESPRQ